MSEAQNDRYRECRCCWSDDPRTVHGEFVHGMCMTCVHLIEGRMRRHRETIEEAISHFEETNVLTQLRELRAEADGDACWSLGCGSEATVQVVGRANDPVDVCEGCAEELVGEWDCRYLHTEDQG